MIIPDSVAIISVFLLQVLRYKATLGSCLALVFREAVEDDVTTRQGPSTLTLRRNLVLDNAC